MSNQDKIKKLFTWIGLLALFIGLVGFKWMKASSQRCNEVIVDLHEENGVQFLTQADIQRKIKSRHPVVIGTKLDSIQLFEIEQSLLEIPQIKKVKAFVDIVGKLHVSVQQRVPVIRIHQQDGTGYYIDEEGVVFSLSNNYSHRVLVVNGFVEKIPNIKAIHEIKTNDKLRASSTLDELYDLGLFVSRNPFWRAQIQQAYVNENQEVVLIPRVGYHIIELGKCTQLERKFNKLEIFYKEGLNYTSWRNYSKINLEFKNQVVCTKK